MCDEAIVEYPDGTILKNEEAMKPFRYRGN